MNDFNAKVIEEFRANKGVVGGRFAGAPMLLLPAVGASSGEPRTNPLVYIEDGNRLIVVASYSGGPKNPPWYFNLKQQPQVTVEVGERKYQAMAIDVAEPERSALYQKVADQMPAFADYAAKTDRVIPVIALEEI